MEAARSGTTNNQLEKMNTTVQNSTHNDDMPNEDKPLLCEHCHKPINVGRILGARTSDKKAEAARKNGKRGGYPKGRPRTKGAICPT